MKGILLEELRRYYDREEDRRKAFDSKSATLLGFSATITQILVAILTLIISQSVGFYFRLTVASFLVAGTFFFASASFSLLASLRARKFEEIMSKEEMELLKNRSDEEQQQMFIDRIGYAAYKNKDENDKKKTRFELAFIFIACGVITLLILGLVILSELVLYN